MHPENGVVAEWLGRGLQNLVQRFESAQRLTNPGDDSSGFFVFEVLQTLYSGSLSGCALARRGISLNASLTLEMILQGFLFSSVINTFQWNLYFSTMQQALAFILLFISSIGMAQDFAANTDIQVSEGKFWDGQTNASKQRPPIEYRLYALGGAAHNLPAYLKFHQTGMSDLEIRPAIFRSESFVLPPYWDFRLEGTRDGYGFGLRMTHHKLILDNAPSAVSGFQISHGFNMINAYNKIPFGKYDLLIGAGITLGHPEGTVRAYSIPENGGVWFDKGYFIGGPNIEVSGVRNFKISDSFQLHLEARFTQSWGKFPMGGDNYVRVRNFAFQGLLGMSYKLNNLFFWQNS